MSVVLHLLFLTLLPAQHRVEMEIDARTNPNLLDRNHLQAPTHLENHLFQLSRDLVPTLSVAVAVDQCLLTLNPSVILAPVPLLLWVLVAKHPSSSILPLVHPVAHPFRPAGNVEHRSVMGLLIVDPLCHPMVAPL